MTPDALGRPAAPIPDPRGWATHHATFARVAAVEARSSLTHGAPPLQTLAIAVTAIAEALTSIAWTELHPPRRFPHLVTRTVDLDTGGRDD